MMGVVVIGGEKGPWDANADGTTTAQSSMKDEFEKMLGADRRN